MKKISLLLLTTVSFLIVSCDLSYHGDEVEYRITGSASTVDVTLNNSDGGTEQYSGVSVPHTYSYSNFRDWFLYISAQNNDSYGSVTVAIYLNGVLKKSATSSGAYVIATASGTIDDNF